MRIAYADPPYLGLARYYDHPESYKWDSLASHDGLIQRLCHEFPDGWALSLHSPSLQAVLPLCPAGVRVAAWVKPFASFKPGVNPGYAWEPVIWTGGRQPRSRSEETVRDWCSVSIALRKGLVGAKPEGFAFWLFRLLGLQCEDEFVDLFPGSNAMGKAWKAWTAQNNLPFNSAEDRDA